MHIILADSDEIKFRSLYESIKWYFRIILANRRYQFNKTGHLFVPCNAAEHSKIERYLFLLCSKTEIQFRDLMNVSQRHECRTTLSVLVSFIQQVFFLLLLITCNISSSIQCKTLIYLNNQTHMQELLFQFETRIFPTGPAVFSAITI
jgi:hypothetical protein